MDLPEIVVAQVKSSRTYRVTIIRSGNVCTDHAELFLYVCDNTSDHDQRVHYVIIKSQKLAGAYSLQITINVKTNDSIVYTTVTIAASQHAFIVQ